MLKIYQYLIPGHIHKQKQHIEVIKSADFLKEYADISQTQTRNGYNPLLEDFSNTRFLLSSRRKKKVHTKEKIDKEENVYE